MKLHLKSYTNNITCHPGSFSVTSHSTQVNTPRLNPSQRPVLALHVSTAEGWKAEFT